MKKVISKKKTHAFKKSLYTLASLTTLMVSSPQAFAQIPPIAFKNFSKHYKKKEYDLVLGAATLDSGFIYNLRFFGNFTPAQTPEGTRDYINDTSTDPLWNLTKVLFPSPAGQLTTERALETNFGKNATPRTLALLQNFANSLREGKTPSDDTIIEEILGTFNKDFNIPEKPEITQLKQELASLPTPAKNGDITQEIARVFKKSNVAKSIWGKITPSLTENLKSKTKPFEEKREAIFSALNDYLKEKQTSEIKAKKAPYEKEIKELVTHLKGAISQEGKSLYPNGMPEQILSAFFDKHFNTQKDIRDFMENLDDTIVNKATLSKQDDYLTAEDLNTIASKTEPYELDEIYDLAEAGSFEPMAPTPYKVGAPLLSNGNTYPYDRQTDALLTTRQPFADCFEMTARHLMNLTLYNPLTKEFDLGSLKKIIKEDNPYFKNLETFYSLQKPQDANNGDIQMRSAWNKVVGDLNALGGNPIRYSKDNKYDLEPGFINFVRVFEKLFGLSLEPLTDNNLEGKKRWVENSLETILKTLNPTRIYRFNTAQLTERDGDLSGNLGITVKNQTTQQNLFSFDIMANVGYHGEIQNLNILLPLSTKDFKEELKTHATRVQPNTATEAIWLATPPQIKEDKIKSPLYLLFKDPISDNFSKINVLKEISRNFKYWKDDLLTTDEKLQSLNKIFGNVLEDLSWEDNYTVKVASPIISDLRAFEELRPTLKNIVQKVQPTLDAAVERLNMAFSNIATSNSSNKIATLPFEMSHTLERDSSLVLHFSAFESLYSRLDSKVKFLYVSDRDLKNFKSPLLSKISVLTFNREKRPRGDNLSYLQGTGKDLSLIIEQENNYGSYVRLNNFTGLEKLVISNSKGISLSGLEDCLNLREIEADSSEMTDLDLKNLKTLKKISLSKAKLTSFKAEELGNLTEIDASYTNFSTSRSGNETFELKGLKNLEKLSIAYSSINSLKSLEECPNLKDLDVSNSKLSKVSVKGLKSLEKLSIANLTLNDIQGLEECKNLKELNASKLQGISTLYLNDLENLKINTTQSSIDNLYDIKEIGSAESLRGKGVSSRGRGAAGRGRAAGIRRPLFNPLDD